MSEPTLRVSTDCWNSAMRVSCHRRLPKSSGELAAAAMTGPATAWAALYLIAKSCGLTWKWTWKLVLQASSIIESWLTMSSSRPLMRSSYCPPRSVFRASLRAQ